MEEILVSVIIPTYSRNEMLERAINSVLNQSYNNIEILVIDDNDPESEYRRKNEVIMKKYINNNVKYIKNERNLGGALSRNVGILNSKGEIVSFLDDDDEYYKDRIKKQVEVFNNSTDEKLALVYGMCEIVDEVHDKSKIFGNKYKGNCLYELLKIDCIAATSQWACKREALLKVGMFSDVPAKQDSMLMLKLFELNYKIDYIDEPLSKFYVHDGIRISNSGKALQGEIKLRNYGRKLYDRLSTNKILEIEFAFARRLMRYYIDDNRTKDILSEVKTMHTIYPFKTIYICLIEILRKIKRSIIK